MKYRYKKSEVTSLLYQVRKTMIAFESDNDKITNHINLHSQLVKFLLTALQVNIAIQRQYERAIVRSS